MKNFSFINAPDVWAEIKADSLRVVRESEHLELPLERSANGRLTSAGKEKVIGALKQFLSLKNWQPRPRVICALPARGVSLRRFSLPAGTKDEFQKRLLLQIESEFPLPPDELAWGWQPLGTPSAAGGAVAKQDVLVAAVKKEMMADYQEIFSASGVSPVFTLSALARNQICPQPDGAHAILDIGARQTELAVFENGAPLVLRVWFWGSEQLPAWDLFKSELDGLAKSFKTKSPETKLFLSGKEMPAQFAAQLAAALGNDWRCEPLPVTDETGFSAALAGLKRWQTMGGTPPLVLRLQAAETGAVASFRAPDAKKWLVRAGGLLLVLVLLPYLEALLLKPHLAKKVAAYQTEAKRLKTIDRELDFLRYLKQNQPPYLDALYVFSQSVSPGVRLDSVTMNGHGEVSLRATFRDGRQVTEFRSHLIDSGTFTNVTVEDQSPMPNGQQVNVRMTAHWKPGAKWPVAETSEPQKIEAAQTNKTNLNPARAVTVAPAKKT